MEPGDALPHVFQNETSQLLGFLCPSALSNAKRRDISNFVKETIKRTFPVEYCLGSSGSFPLRSYLPESDLDMVIVTGGGSQEEAPLILAVFNALCLTIVETDAGNNRDFAFVIRNVEFRNARTKLAHCVVNNLDVDITVNQINALESNLLLEEADRAIGQDHIVKKSLLLLKAWCSHDTAKYCGVSILGSKDGMFSSYALSVMVLYMFKVDQSQQKQELKTPFLVFRQFLNFFSTFQWSRYVLTLDGPVAITAGGQKPDVQFPVPNLAAAGDVIGSTISKIKEHRLGRKFDAQVSAPFPLRCCNIVDPINESNNLGFNITKDCLERIDVALKGGHHHLETLIRMLNHAQAPMNVAPALSSSYEPSNATLSAFVIPAGSSTSYPTFPQPFTGKASGSSVSSGGPTRPRAESAGGVIARASVAPENASSNYLYGGSLYTSGSEYLTVFFAQCRARYMVNTTCRHDLLDHPKQRGSFFGQMGRPDNGSGAGGRPGSALEETDSQIYRDESDDALSGEVSEMWATYHRAMEFLRTSSMTEKTSNTEKRTFSALSPSSDLTEPIKYDARSDCLSSSGSKEGADGAEDAGQPKISEHNATNPIDTLKDGYPNEKNFSARDGTAEPETNDKAKLVETPSPQSAEAIHCQPTCSPPARGLLFAANTKAVFSRKRSKSKAANSSIGHGEIVKDDPHIDDKKFLAPQADRNSNTPLGDCRDAAVQTSPCENNGPFGEVKRKYESRESSYSSTRGQHDTLRIALCGRSTSFCMTALMLCLCYVALYFASGDFGQDFIHNVIAKDAVIKAPLFTDKLASEIISSFGCQGLSREADVLCKYLNNDYEPKYVLRLSTLVHWITKGSNITVATDEHISSAFGEMRSQLLQSICSESMPIASPGVETVEPSPDGSKDLRLGCHEKTPDLMFAWYRDGSSDIIKYCSRGPCDLSMFHVTAADEGRYDFVMLRQGPDMLDAGKHVVISSVVIKISEPPISLSKPVYLTLGMGANLYLHIKAEGVPEPSLQWYKNGFMLAGQNRPVLHIQSVNKFDEGTYTCELRNIAGSFVWQEGAVSVRSIAPPQLVQANA